MIRKPYVAGQFYPADKASLTRQLSSLCEEREEKERAIAAISPHAGYIYSGKVAGKLFSAIRIPPTCIILCPNHSGVGNKCSIMTSGEWVIPTASIPINESLARAIVDRCEMVKEDARAHTYEHSLEVQLPFIYYLRGEFSFVPITLKSLSLPECRVLGEKLAEATHSYGETVLIIASTDMSHYEPDRIARIKDKKAIERILELDGEGLFSIVRDEDISMCGYVPTAVTIFASQKLGAKEAKLVEYATSGDESGDYQKVVGYAGIFLK